MGYSPEPRTLRCAALGGRHSFRKASPPLPGSCSDPSRPGRPALRDPDRPDPVMAVLAILLLLIMLVLVLKF
jgi:hypothetical protein